MEDPAIPSSLIGAITFFLLLGIIAFVVVKEAVKIILKPALVLIGLALVAVWAGVLDETALHPGVDQPLHLGDDTGRNRLFAGAQALDTDQVAQEAQDVVAVGLRVLEQVHGWGSERCGVGE